MIRNIDTYFHPLAYDYPKPERFTYPFRYEPHPLAVMAAGELMRYLESVRNLATEAARGKMFGVLVVEDSSGQTGFLAAYSGLLCGCNDLPYFVPAVYDMLHPDGHFKVGERKISEINAHVAELENSPERKALQQELAQAKELAGREIADYRDKMGEAKRRRDELRSGNHDRNADENEEQLIRESQFMKAQLRRIKKSHAEQIETLELRLNDFEAEIASLKNERQRRSDELQKWIFAQFRMRNALGEEADLNEIFHRYSAENNTFSSVPPAGSGECCAPKLLQFAYRHGLKPVCMAEFWYGRSPVGEIRHHGQYYPSCRGKCLPILSFMLRGLEVDQDTRERSGTVACEEVDTDCPKGLELIYDDEYIAVVNKPAGMLSVPGKGDEKSVYSIVREMFPQADEPIMVHRLDMDTSGVMVVAKTKQAHEHMQRQFAEHSIRKRYIALVQAAGCRDAQTELGNPLKIGTCGTIDLPLSPDYLDRPRQIVDFSSGKPAVTEYRVLEILQEEMPCANAISGKAVIKESSIIARIELKPLTGRTHQLRVHCAHAEGLASPIVGDPLYGLEETDPAKRAATENSLLTEDCEMRSIVSKKPARMYLHAATLELTHPITGERKIFHAEPEF